MSAVMEVGTVANGLPRVWRTTTADRVTVSPSLSAPRCYNNDTPRGQEAIWVKQTQTPTFSFFGRDKGIHAHSWITILRMMTTLTLPTVVPYVFLEHSGRAHNVLTAQ